jgi:hypothetical protein
MITYSVYDLETGLFTGLQISTSSPSPEWILASTPPGCELYEGVVDHTTHKYDLKTCTLVAHRPEPPSPDHEWDVIGKLWVNVIVRRREEAQAAIDALERKQLRSLRESLIETDLLRRESAVDRVKDIDDQIKELRKQL